VSTDHRNRAAQIEHIALAAQRPALLWAFYCLLGGDPGEAGGGCVLDFCGVRLEVCKRSSPRQAHLGFALGSADAVDELTLALALAGHRMVEPPHRAGDAGRYESLVLDPDGNGVRLTV
jgi:hypothetical protein